MKLNLKQMTETKKRKITKASLQNLWKLYHYILPYRFEFIIGIILLMLSSLPSLAFPYLVGKLFDAGDKGLFDQITFYVLILAGLLIFQALFSYFRVVLFVNVTEKSLAALRQATYNHLIKLPVKFFEKRRVGELNSRIFFRYFSSSGDHDNYFGRIDPSINNHFWRYCCTGLYFSKPNAFYVGHNPRNDVVSRLFW
jgi:ABC-type bacteriocin/lantibiotic exporter with double-glycine peptidase domain